MHPGTALIWALPAFCGLALALSLLALFSPRRLASGAADRAAGYANYGAFLMASASLAFLFWLFLSSDFSSHYVWEHSSSTYPLWEKMAGLWAGQAGSLLLWLWVSLLGAAATERFTLSRMRAVDEGHSPRFGPIFRACAMLPAAVFAALIAINDPFAPLHSTARAPDPLGMYPQGFGLSPELTNFWMAIHPPMILVGYGLAIIPFSLAIAYSATGSPGWKNPAAFWGRVSWIFLSLGIGLGAVWAYAVMGWGGYWGWDAVEISSLFPWLMLASFLHAMAQHRKCGDFPKATPLLAVFTFCFVLFSAYVTRGGGLASLHAWEGRMAATLGFGALMAGILCLGGLLILTGPHGAEGSGKGERGARSAEDKGERNGKGPGPEAGVDDVPPKGQKKQDAEEWLLSRIPQSAEGKRSLATIAFLCLLALLLLMTMLSLKGAPQGGLYEARLFPFLFIIAFTLGICAAAANFKRLRWQDLLVGMLLFGLAGAIIAPWAFSGTDSYTLYALGSLTIGKLAAAGFVLPALFFGLLASSYSLLLSQRRNNGCRRLRPRMHSAGAPIVHIGIMVLLIGYVVSCSGESQESVMLETGKPADFAGYEIVLMGKRQYNDGDTRVAEYTVEVRKGGTALGHASPRLVTFTSGQGASRVVPEGGVFSTPASDLFIIMDHEIIGANNSMAGIRATAKSVPFANMLWAGVGLLALGLVIRMAGGTGASPREDDASGKARVPEGYK